MLLTGWLHYITLQKLLSVRYFQKAVHWRITEFNIDNIEHVSPKIGQAIGYQ